MMIKKECLRAGITNNWKDSYELIDSIGQAIDAVESTEAAKRNGFSENLFATIANRDNAVRNAIKRLNAYNIKYSILSRKINPDSYQDCIKALKACYSAFYALI